MNTSPHRFTTFAFPLLRFVATLALLAGPLLPSAVSQPGTMFGTGGEAKRAEYEKTAVPLWDARAPQARGDAEADKPMLYPVLPVKGGTPVAAVIVLPGGGYRNHAAHEAVPIAEYFRSKGLAAFVLQYRLRPYPDTVSLLDAQRAVRLLRARAAEFNIDASKIAVIGFSAGGHLGANLSSHADDGLPDAADPVDRQGCRIQTAMLIYPWLVFQDIERKTAADRDLAEIVKLAGLHRSVDAKTPPTFLVVGFDDDRTPYEHCLAYTAKLHQAGVRFELHILGTGGHGFAMRSPDPRLQTWPQLAMNWLVTCGFLAMPGAVP